MTDTGSLQGSVVRRRSAWSLADQVVSSVTNLVLLVMVARSTSLAEIGAFTVAFTVYQFVLAVSRPLNTDPLIVRFSAAAQEGHHRAAAGAAGGALCLGLLIVPVGLLAWATVGGSPGRALLALAVFAPALFLQDAWRFVFVSAGTPRRALENDVAMLVSLLVFGVMAANVTPPRAVTFVIAWGAAALVGVVVGAVQTTLRPRLAAGRAWWRETGSLGSRMLGENVLAMGAYSLTLLSIAVVSGVPALGKLRTAQVAIAVTNPVMLAAGMVVAAEGTRLRSAGDRRLTKLVARAWLAVSAVPVLVAAVWWALPESAGRRLLGDGWSSARPLVLGAALLGAGIGATTVLSAGLRATERAASALRCRAVTAPLTVSGGLVGAWAAGPEGAVLAMAAAEAVGTALMWRTFRRATGEEGVP